MIYYLINEEDMNRQTKSLKSVKKIIVFYTLCIYLLWGQLVNRLLGALDKLS